ncbi:MAG: hypothetical protein DI539_00145 [Flavobacterium psychrophilum]|nr:MAG: hypothetical protein DI539_00145 [Flavobacterium psychrophilum]
MKNLLFLFLLAIVSCRTPLGTPTIIYGVVEKKEGYIWYSIDQLDSLPVYIEEAKAEKYLGKYVKAKGYASHRHVHFVGGGSAHYHRMFNIKFTVVKDCDAILQIINTPEFDKSFNISKRPADSLTFYIGKEGNIDASILCNNIKIYGKAITFAKTNFEVKIDETSRTVTNPRIVVWKEKDTYRFFETETNLNFDATVKRGKVKILGRGAF